MEIAVKQIYSFQSWKACGGGGGGGGIPAHLWWGRGGGAKASALPSYA